MNYLVHLYLSGPNPEHRLGGLMGDFVKGPVPQDIAPGLSRGLHLHRRIDSLAHANIHTRRSRQRLHPRFGHGRGIIVDIFYDHFLASSWQQFSAQPLEHFAQEVYLLLQSHQAQLPQDMREVARRMTADNWLVSYRRTEVVGRALQRIAARLKRPLPLEDAIDDLNMHEKTLREDFSGFMAEAVDFVGREFAIAVQAP